MTGRPRASKWIGLSGSPSSRGRPARFSRTVLDKGESTHFRLPQASRVGAEGSPLGVGCCVPGVRPRIQPWGPPRWPRLRRPLSEVLRVGPPPKEVASDFQPFRVPVLHQGSGAATTEGIDQGRCTPETHTAPTPSRPLTRGTAEAHRAGAQRERSVCCWLAVGEDVQSRVVVAAGFDVAIVHHNSCQPRAHVSPKQQSPRRHTAVPGRGRRGDDPRGWGGHHTFAA